MRSLLLIAAVVAQLGSSRADPFSGPRAVSSHANMDCGNDVEFMVCIWNRVGYRAKETTESFRKLDAAAEQCRIETARSELRDYVIDHQNDIPQNRELTFATYERCKRCKAKYGTPGGCPRSDAGATDPGGKLGNADPDKAPDLARCFEQTARDKIRAGYFVKNDGFWRSRWHDIKDHTWWADVEKGGRCGEYGAHGMEWIKPCVDNLFGPNAIIDDIIVEEKSSVRARAEGADFTSRWSPDLMFESNHRATRVVLPDGRRFVVDYWQAISSGNPRMVPESEWTATWNKRVGDQLIGIDSGVVQWTEDQVRLRTLVKTHGEARAFDIYRKTYSPTTLGPNVRAKGDPDTWIRSWKLDPW